jgi:hypothetical protein
MPRADICISSISFGQLIYIRRCLLRYESLCRAIPSHRQDNTGNLDQGTHLPTIGWNIKLLYIDSVP